LHILTGPALTGFLTQTESSFSTEVRAKQEQIDRTNAQIQELSALQKSENQKYDTLASALRARTERRQRLLNLQRGARSQRLARQKQHGNVQPGRVPSTLSPGGANGAGPTKNGDANAGRVPRLQALRDRVNAYNKANASLRQQAAALKARNGQLENGYRKVVSLCTGVPENRVEEMLPMLLAAVESEGGRGVETGRVNEFLRNMQGVEG
jgi:regulatory protein SWI6